MKNNFNAREREKRCLAAQELWQRGTPLHEVAKTLCVEEETVKRYIEEAGKKEERIDEHSLFAFTTKTTTVDTIFSDQLEEGFRCLCCKRYAKKDAGVVWKEQAFICKMCFPTLTGKEIEGFMNVQDFTA